VLQGPEIVPVGEVETLGGGLNPPPHVVPSVVVTFEHLLEFPPGAANSAELIIITPIRTATVFLMSPAFMTSSGLDSPPRDCLGVCPYVKAIEMPG